MKKTVDVAIIGAGTAGLFALREVKKGTNDFVLIDPGPLGTTCARVACMPSKLLIQAANVFHGRHKFHTNGIMGGEDLKPDIKKVMESVRKRRDKYVESVLKTMEEYKDHLIQEKAVFKDKNTLQVGDQMIIARKIIIATGSSPNLLKDTEKYASEIITSDRFFEQIDLPNKISVVGLGPVGAELGQALSWLGLEVKGFHANESLGGLTDPVVQAEAYRIFSSEFSVFKNTKISLKGGNTGVNVVTADNTYETDLVLASIGRSPNLESLHLENTGAVLNSKGVPEYNPHTMQLRDLPIFIAGDVDGHRAVVPEASDEGRIAGYNSVREEIHSFKRRVPLSITFTGPNIVMVGTSFKDLQTKNFAIGEVSFNDQGRAGIEQENRGILRVYGDKETGVLLGAEMVAPGGEHLGHLLALAIYKELTVHDILKMPFYHPVIEQGLRTALRDLSHKVEKKVPDFEIAFCDFPDLGIY